MRKYYAEFFGTMFLVLLACGAAVLAGPKIGVLGIGLCFGLVLVALCYCIGGISGCHVNPAVSLGVFLTDKSFTFKQMLGYWVAQLSGAALGAFFLWTFVKLGGTTYDFGGITQSIGLNGGSADLAANVCQSGVSTSMALFAEVLFTFFFVLVVIGATSKWGNTTWAGGAIGLALGLVNIVGIPVDNCSVNPARSFGPALFSPGAWPDFWIMVVGPLLGAALAAIVWFLVKPSKVPQAS